jgi:hypothetical protein
MCHRVKRENSDSFRYLLNAILSRMPYIAKLDPEVLI